MNDDDVVERLIKFNSDREPERLKIKLKNMAADPFAFFRGTCHLFFEDWPTDKTELDHAPAVWVCGDLHLENFGSYKGDNRLTYFDINDFDESTLAPLTWDVTRLVTSLRLAAKLHNFSPSRRRDLERTYLTYYRGTLQEGKARWIERATAEGLVRDLLVAVRERDRKSFLADRTRLKGRRRVLRDIKGKNLPIDRDERRMVEAAMATVARTKQEERFFRVIDVKRRIAGTGNLGLGRYVVLVAGRGSPDGNFLVDLKENHPSALEPWLKDPPNWPSPAERVVALQQRLQAIAPALLRTMAFADRSWTLRELQPIADRVEIGKNKPGARELDMLMKSLGCLTAWAHLRSGGRDGSATADALIDYGRGEAWPSEVRTYAKLYARRVRQDWLAFCKAREKGAFAHLVG
jgi:uncharacterized protein (DUF2252 family)